MANENTYTHSFLSTNKLLRNSFYTLCYMLIVLKSFLWAKQNLTVFKIAIFSYSLLPKIFRFRRSSLRLVFLIKIVYNIVWTPPAPFSKQGEVNFDCLPGRGESEKLEKGGGSMVQWQVLLSVCVWGGDWHVSYLSFSRFIICTYRNYIILCKILQNCVMHLKRSYFFLSP